MKLLLIFLFAFTTPTVWGAFSSKEVKYRTYFGKCPSRTAGTLTLKLIKRFEDSRSLKDVKKTIIDENLKEKHFISNYQIEYNPLKKFLTFQYNCPGPLMKAHIYKDDGKTSYEAVLVENGEFYDPTYEILLRTEKKLTGQLPSLAIPVELIGSEQKQEVSEIVAGFTKNFRKKLSEVILNREQELTVILSIDGQPSSVFLGRGLWSEKTEKLKKIVRYMEAKGKIPAVINLTNLKKVVVKFSD